MFTYKARFLVSGGKMVVRRFHADSELELLGWLSSILDVVVVGVYKINSLGHIIG